MGASPDTDPPRHLGRLASPDAGPARRPAAARAQAGAAAEGESTPARDAFLSAVNGIYGDYLARTGNPLALEMELRVRGRRFEPDDPTRAFEPETGDVPSGKLLVLVHGLCMNDQQLTRDGHDHGKALADEFGYTPLYLRYNSGLHIAANGRSFADLLERVTRRWPVPVEELAILGPSMGGLVARSACRHGLEAGHAWLKHLRKLMFLGSPMLSATSRPTAIQVSMIDQGTEREGAGPGVRG